MFISRNLIEYDPSELHETIGNRVREAPPLSVKHLEFKLLALIKVIKFNLTFTALTSLVV
jgi:hypothetical protein